MSKQWWLEWCFPELSSQENAIVAVARKNGYASFFPTYPDAHSQAHSTLRGAIKHLGIDKPEGYFTPSPIAQEINALRLEIEVENLSRCLPVGAAALEGRTT